MGTREPDHEVLDWSPEGVVLVDGGGQKVERPAAPDPKPRGAGAAGSTAVPRVVEIPAVMIA